jgi:hypothetical protein
LGHLKEKVGSSGLYLHLLQHKKSVNTDVLPTKDKKMTLSLPNDLVRTGTVID